jgi:hypothetical protein
VDVPAGFSWSPSYSSTSFALAVDSVLLSLINADWTSSGVKLELNGDNALGPVVIYASSDLVSWVPIYTNPPTVGPIVFVDPASKSLPRRFYQAIEH